MHIYIGQTRNGKIKIGSTTKIDRRTKQIKQANKSYKQKYVYEFQIVDKSDLIALEDIIRAEMAKLQFANHNIKRFGNDWSKCSNNATATMHIETIVNAFDNWLKDTNLKYIKVAQ